MVQVFDSWAGELSPTDFATFSLPYLLQIPITIHSILTSRGYYSSNPKVPTIVFAKGAWYALEDLAQSDYDVISLDWTHDPAQARKRVGPNKVLQGNMDPNVLYGPRENITKHVEQIVQGFGGGKGGYIVNLGHGITPVFLNLTLLTSGCQPRRLEMVPRRES
jgi:uroporphyrinogen decarboxylase